MMEAWLIIGIPLDLAGCFSTDYASARSRFLAETADLGRSKRYRNPGLGPNGEELSTDVAWIGPADAAHVLVMVSATHGVEGFCGAGAQVDAARNVAPHLPPDTALLLIHAINPYGFAWLRRVTEENVDLNRNGVDFSKPLPENPGYAELADAFVPVSLSGAAFYAAQKKLSAWREIHGDKAYENARSGGQHLDPQGIFYGGTEPTWAMRTIEAICGDFDLAARRSVAVIDYHTGLGPYGYAEPICGHRPGDSGQARCRDWYGGSLGEPLLGTSSSLPIVGLTQFAWGRFVGTDRLTFIALEYGTYPAQAVAEAVQAEQWLHRYGEVEWTAPETQRIKAAMRRAYYPDTPDWKELVLLRSRQVISQALRGVTARP
jgi:hypothetical protein